MRYDPFWDRYVEDLRDKEYQLGQIVASKKRIAEALEVAVKYGGIDGDHHKAWVIDQMVRALTGSEYERFVNGAKAGEEGPETYSWDEGVAP